MIQIMLKLKPSKTECMIICNLTQRKDVAHIFPVELLNQNFAEVDSIRSLGVFFIQLCHSRNMSLISVDLQFI